MCLFLRMRRSSASIRSLQLGVPKATLAKLWKKNKHCETKDFLLHISDRSFFIQRDVQDIRDLSLCQVTTGSSESTALNNTVRGEAIARLYKYDVIKQTYLLGSQEKYSVWREREIPSSQGPVERNEERESKKRGGKKKKQSGRAKTFENK